VINLKDWKTIAEEAYKNLGSLKYDLDDFIGATGSFLTRLEHSFKNKDSDSKKLLAIYEPVRQELRRKFGSTITLYRSQPKPPFKIKRILLSFSDNQSMAWRFIPRGEESKYDKITLKVKVEDIIAIPKRGNYYEFVVKETALPVKYK
jgi:hypothetical protein